jgi:phage terminase large subunit GpA-like protein
MGILVDPELAAVSVVARVMAPPPPADLNLWAERHIAFGRESPTPGPYRRETIPPAARILECLGPEHPARTVALVTSAQFFKTTLAQVFIGGSMDLDPCDIGYTHPTHDNAMRWARRKWKVMRKQSDALRRIFGESKSRDSTDTTLYQETKDGLGSLQVSGAQSEASLSMASWPKQVQDDLAKWEPNEGGDPERQADSRSAAFDWAKIFKISTPLFAKTCRITRAYKAGTQERWHVPCPHCNHFQPLEWANFQANIDREHPERAHFTCVSCNLSIEHRHKLEIVERGKWIAENPRAKDPSFHIWRAYSPFRDWESIARQWLADEGDPHAEQTFYNDVLGLPFERASEAPPWESIRNRANGTDADGKILQDASVYDRGQVAHGALLICIGVDCQGDRTEVHIKGYGANLRRWTVDYLVIPHHIATVEARDELDKLLKTTWPDAFGNRRGVDMLAIDGNAWTNDVFGWVRERKHPWTKVIIVRGAKSDHAPPLALTKTERKADGKTRRAQKRFYNVGVSGLKSSLYEHLKKVDPLSRGHCAYPRGFNDDFYMQLTAERREIVVDRWGFPKAVWRLDHDRNEVLDTECYAEAAAIRCGWYTRPLEDWARMSGEREKPNETGQSDLFDPSAPLATTTQAHPAAVNSPVRAAQPFIPRRGNWL